MQGSELEIIEVVDDVIVVEVAEEPVTVEVSEEVVEVVVGEGALRTEWGSITGTLADQRDLQAVLDEKADADDLGDLAWKDQADWDEDIDNIPSAFPPAAHTHDDRYYTEGETDTLLAGKQDALTFDSTPTAGSTNPVTSGGIKTALDLKANLASPVFTGNPQAPTQSKGNNSKRIATTAFVQTAISDKQNTLTFDSTPTAGSTNPVMSDGINTALAGKLDLHGTADNAGAAVPVVLSSGTDLNDLRPDDVTWYYTTAGIPSSILNRPYTSNTQFTMVVYRTGTATRIQVLMRIDGIFYSRYYRNNTWSEWVEWNVNYQLPTASASVLGGVKVGRNLSIDSAGVLSADAAGVINTVSGNPVIFPDGANAPVDDLTAAIEPIQVGRNDPAPDNIRPILGWTGSSISNTIGKNLWCPDWVIVGGPQKEGNNNQISSTATVRSVVCPVISGRTYTMSKITSNRCRYAFTKDYPKTNVNATVIIANDSATEITFTVPDDYQWFICSVGNNESNIDNVLASVQIEEGLTATAYEAWQGVNIPITFPAEAGTVYGGTLDVTTGVLTITHGEIASYNGETLPGTWISDRDVYAAGTTPTTGAQVVYVLASPVTCQLLPTEIMTLLGNNTISVDTGPVALRYHADTKVYIDSRLAELQALILEN